MKKSTSITRTFGPIHFEDLDPHRFEDLIRELIYDFRDWQSIEATGRTGNNAGFDILFTFFGISLTSMRRSRVTEVQSFVNTKNKLIKLLGSAQDEFDREILSRDINDNHWVGEIPLECTDM